MERKYPLKMFLFFTLTTFLFRYFYLFVSGMILCVVGIWVKPCLWIGLFVLAFDLIISIIGQLRFRKAVITPSNNPDFNAFADALCGPGGLAAVKKLADEKIAASQPIAPDGE